MVRPTCEAKWRRFELAGVDRRPSHSEAPHRGRLHRDGHTVLRAHERHRGPQARVWCRLFFVFLPSPWEGQVLLEPFSSGLSLTAWR